MAVYQLDSPPDPFAVEQTAAHARHEAAMAAAVAESPARCCVLPGPSTSRPAEIDAEPAARHPDAGPSSAPAHPDAGPSFLAQAQAAGRGIPPPSSPRRHRSTVLMSRVRANSGGSALGSLAMSASKSVGDLVGFGTDAADSDDDDDDDDDDDARVPGTHEQAGEAPRAVRGTGPAREVGGNGKRVFSEGSRGYAEDGADVAIWDNSARFYHHIHSQAGSRAASRASSPTRSNLSISPIQPTSTASSPIFVRRNLTLPTPGPNASGSGQSAALSPNQSFLHQHLPPTFPVSDADSLSPQQGISHSMVILTPTTQDWQQLEHIRRLKGDTDVDLSEDSDSGSDDLSSPVQPLSSSILLQGTSSDEGLKRPPLPRKSMSADFLAEEVHHTADPGASPERPISHLPSGMNDGTPSRPVFNSTIIAPSPIMTTSGPVDYSQALDARLSLELTPTEGMADLDGAPVRFSSIGRSQSLRTVPKTQSDTAVPRVRTKRELERERLFKAMDEEIADGIEEKAGSWGIQEIGSGRGLQSGLPTPVTMPPVAEIQLDKPQASPLQRPEARAVTAPLGPKPFFDTAIPVKPSPLHASQISASGLPTPTSESSTPSARTPTDEVEEPRAASPRAAPPLDNTDRYEAIRNYARAMSTRHTLIDGVVSPPRSPRRRDTTRVSLVAGRVVQPFTAPPGTALPHQGRTSSLQSFSPFRSPSLGPGKPLPPPAFSRFDSTVSLAPSMDAPSDCGTPTSETAGGVGGRGIDDYVILSEAGKGAYGLVMRARVKGEYGEPVGDEVIIKYIIKARILADCWKKHKLLGPIPIEIHVMDQLRHLPYHAPTVPLPWDPSRPRPGPSPADHVRTPVTPSLQTSNLPPVPPQRLSPLSRTTTPASPAQDESAPPGTPSSLRSDGSAGISAAQRFLAAEMRHAPERGHPNICKLLDFFEDREFYYLVMPRYGTGVDLFDRVESQPAGLDPFEVRSLLGQLADALAFLHANSIVHRDIKDENVILDGAGRCQLIDFGSAAHWRPGRRWDTFSGTLHYASPEILRGELYGGKEQDVWALGVVAYVLLVGETPFADLPDDVFDALADHTRALAALAARCAGPHADDGAEPDGGGRLEDAADLVRACLAKDQADRPGADDLLRHRYLAGRRGWTGRKGWLEGHA
ncbi:serine/threonine protein kinase [Cryptotrichosporon argae]